MTRDEFGRYLLGELLWELEKFGVAHTYEADDARYLIILTPRLRDLIAELHQTSDQTAHGEIYRKYRSELLE